MVKKKRRQSAARKDKLRPIITLTTDFGISDPFVGIMKGVILSIAPEAEIIDITHQIKPQDISQASYALGSFYSYFPEGSIHVIVVDPGVGGARKPMAGEFNGHTFVAPDNGVLTPVIKPGFKAWELTQSKYFLNSISASFHGRDIFAPSAAWLARGTRLPDLGRRLSNPCVIDLPQATFAKGSLTGSIIYKDRFGNLVSNISYENLIRCFGELVGLKIKLGNKISILDIAPNYATIQQGKMGAIINSWNNLEIFCTEGDAAKVTRCDIGETLVISK